MTKTDETSDGRGVARGMPRVVTAQRDQIEWRAFDVDALIADDHRARTIWAAVERMDLGSFYDEISARDGEPGRPPFDPKVLLALWLYATSEAVGSARQLARLCERDHVYMWICGGLKPNHHTLSDFRAAHGDKLDVLLSQLLASLMAAGVVTLKRVAQDGTRVRANAGAASFRRGSTLRERCLVKATEQVEELRRELDEDPSASSAREKSARERAARERLDAVERALKELPKVAKAHERSQRRRANKIKKSRSIKSDDKKSEPRVSTTDPEARVMKMGDGGFRPAYNLQFATDTESRLIIGVEVVTEGSDQGQMTPMLEQVIERTGRQPEQYLVDGGYTKLEAIDAAESKGTHVYAPVAAARCAGVDAYERKPNDTDRTAAWRARMKSDEAKRIYSERASTAETVHADLRTWRGLGRLPVRGRLKVRAVALLQALTYNLLRIESLTA